MTRAPRSSSRFRRSADWEAARVMTIVLPVSTILGDLGENFSGSHRKKFLSKLKAQLVGLANQASHFFSNHPRPIKAGNETFNCELASSDSGLSCDRNLTAPAKRSKKTALCSDGQTCRLMIQNCECASRCIIVGPAYNAKRTLSNGRDHDVVIENLRDSLFMTEALESGCSQDDSIKLAL